jgi:hypothetical protein
VSLSIYDTDDEKNTSISAPTMLSILSALSSTVQNIVWSKVLRAWYAASVSFMVAKPVILMESRKVRILIRSKEGGVSSPVALEALTSFSTASHSLDMCDTTGFVASETLSLFEQANIKPDSSG